MIIKSPYRRIGASVFGSLSVAALSFLTSILLSNIFSPSDFGLYQYMLSVGQSIILIAGLNLSNAYFTYISKSHFHLSYHFVFSAVQTVVICIAIYFVVLLLRDQLFESLDIQFILICLLGSFGFFALRQQSIYLLESQRKNSFLQFILVATALLNFFVLFILSRNMYLEVSDVFLIMAIEYFLFWCVSLFISRIGIRKVYVDVKWRNEAASYTSYVKPLIISLVIVQLCMIFDRWLLQVNSGAIEQGYFGIALRIATIATIVSASIVNIFWKEVSSLLLKNERSAALNLLVTWHDQVTPLVFLGCLYIFVNAERILALTYGSNYVDSVQALKLMSFYPLLQTSVHLLSTFLYADEKTTLLSKASIISTVLGALSIWFLFSIDIGLTGSVILSLKFILVSLILIVILSRRLGVLLEMLPLKKYLVLFPLLFVTNMGVEEWLASYEIASVLHLLLVAMFMGATYLIIFGLDIRAQFQKNRSL